MKKNILIVEDNDATADLLQFYFEDEGHQVTRCISKKDLKQSIDTVKPDLISIDIVLPKVNGLDLIKYLKDSSQTKDIPIIIVSVKESEKESGLALGALDFFGKPIDKKLLIDKVNHILKERSH